MIFILLRRLGPRARMITGAVLVVAGLAVIAVSAVVAGLLIHGAILTVVGAGLCLSAVAGRRRARRTADQPTVEEELIREGSGHGR
jgi:hypothetical protein